MVPWDLFSWGCSYHLTYGPSLLTTVNTTTILSRIHTTSGQPLCLLQRGLIISMRDSFGSFILAPIYVASHLCLNLISIRYLCNVGLIFYFSSSACLVQDPPMRRHIGRHRYSSLLSRVFAYSDAFFL